MRGILGRVGAGTLDRGIGADQFELGGGVERAHLLKNEFGIALAIGVELLERAQ
jgi:hypothetical protein